MKKIKHILELENLTHYLYIFFATTGLITFIVLLYAILYSVFADSFHNLAYYLSAFAILISAFLASMSVMKSIQNSNLVSSNSKKENQEQDLLHLQTLLISLHNELNMLFSTYECIKQRVKKSNGMMRTDIYLLDLLKLNQERVITRLDKIENSKLLVSIGKNSRKNLTLVITQYSTINTYINYVISQHELTPNNIQELDQTIVPVYKNIIFLIESIRKNINGEHYQLKIYNQDAFSHIYSTNKQRFCI